MSGARDQNPGTVMREIVTDIDLSPTPAPKPNEKEPEFDIEVVDDTPPPDRGKARGEVLTDLPPGTAPPEDELKQYSESVQKRFKRMTYEFHEQRRARESSDRQLEEAARIARQLYEDNVRMRSNMKAGEQVLVENARGRVEAMAEAAREKMRKAHESGDTEALIKAQEEVSAIQSERARVFGYQPQYQQEEQYIPPAPQRAPQQAPVPPADPQAEDWARKNDWFQKDRVMTGAAFGVHQELVEAGVDPRVEPDVYYKALDTRMREQFPNHDWGDRQETPQQQRRQMSSVVAPATRSNAGVSKDGRKVTLTSSQISLAKRLGLTPQQYAAEVLKQAREQ